MVTPAALVIAPPARLMGLLPKNSAGRTQFSRNRCIISSPPRQKTRFSPRHSAGTRFHICGTKRVSVRLLQRAEICDDILDLLIGKLSGKCLHLSLAVLHRLNLLFLSRLVLRCGFHVHHFRDTRTRRARAAVTALTICLVERFTCFREAHGTSQTHCRSQHRHRSNRLRHARLLQKYIMARSLGATPIHLLQTARNLPIQTPLSDESSCLVITVPCPSD